MTKETVSLTDDDDWIGPMTLEQAMELGKTDNEANWDNPVRMKAYRIRAERSDAIRECKRRGLNPFEICADGGVEAWMVVAKETR